MDVQRTCHDKGKVRPNSVRLNWTTSSVQAQFQFASPVTYPFTGDVYHAVAQDANADGYPDLLVAGGSWNHAVVFYNDRTGGFATPQYFTYGDFCAAVSVAPIDCNSSPDLLMAMANDGRVEVLPTNGLGVFSAGLRQYYLYSPRVSW